MSGTATAVAELTEPVAAASATPRRPHCPTSRWPMRGPPSPGTPTRSAPTVVGEPIVMDDGRIGHAEIAIAGGVLYLADEYPELGLKAPAAGGGFGQPDAARRRHRCGLSSRPADHGADRRARNRTRTTAARNATIIDPFGHRWMLTGPRRRHPDSAWRHRVRLGVGSRRRSGGRVLRSRAGLDLRPRLTPGDEYRPSDRHLRRRRGGHPVLLLRRRGPVGRSRGDQPKRAAWRARSREFELRHGARRHRSPGQRRSRSSSRPPAGNARSSTDLDRVSCRMSPTRWPIPPHSAISTAGCSAGPSNPAASRTAGRCRLPTRWPAPRAAAGSRARCRCGPWPTSTRQSRGSARPAAPCWPNHRASPMA